jgi:hypothetical protein
MEMLIFMGVIALVLALTAFLGIRQAKKDIREGRTLVSTGPYVAPTAPRAYGSPLSGSSGSSGGSSFRGGGASSSW